MSADRPEKATVRELWVSKVEAHHEKSVAQASQERLYLTLCGADGRDIDALIKRGILSRTETGSLTPQSAARVAAIENSGLAVTKLLAKFPGLKVHPQSYESLLHGPNPTKFPIGLNEELCRSRVINLDLNTPLASTPNADATSFPLIDFIRKFSTIHLAGRSLDWCLLLTLHAQLQWEDEVWKFISRFLSSNFELVPAFMHAAKAVLGSEVVTAILQGELSKASAASIDQQKLLLAVVPKLIAESVRDQRWLINVDWGLSYGGGISSAPMVTWAMDFSRAPAGQTLGEIYEGNVGRILERAGMIDKSGMQQLYT